MNIQRSTFVCAAALAASISTSYAGPCSPKIARVDQVIDARIHAKASAGATAPESTAATLHRQPTPSSTSAAEVKLGLTSTEQFKAIKSAMARARKADRAGNGSACEQALADVKRLLGSAGTQTNDAQR
jgi:hypothetical protein